MTQIYLESANYPLAIAPHPWMYGAMNHTLPRRSRQALETAAVGYARRSTDKQEQSIADQKRAIER